MARTALLLVAAGGLSAFGAVSASSGQSPSACGRAGILHVMWGDEGLDLAKTTAERRVHRLAYDRDILKFDAPWEGGWLLLSLFHRRQG